MGYWLLLVTTKYLFLTCGVSEIRKIAYRKHRLNNLKVTQNISKKKRNISNNLKGTQNIEIITSLTLFYANFCNHF